MNESDSTDRRSGWLIVEDESLVAMLIEEAIEGMGLSPLGPVGRVDKALEFLRDRVPDGAILDINLAGEPVYPVARTLASLGVPFAFVTGYGAAGVRAEFASVPTVRKPFALEEVRSVIRRLRSQESPGHRR